MSEDWIAKNSIPKEKLIGDKLESKRDAAF